MYQKNFRVLSRIQRGSFVVAAGAAAGAGRHPNSQQERSQMPMLDSYLFFNGSCAEAAKK
jgi:hypothetical protein